MPRLELLGRFRCFGGRYVSVDVCRLAREVVDIHVQALMSDLAASTRGMGGVGGACDLVPSPPHVLIPSSEVRGLSELARADVGCHSADRL